ncbi:hypothetical protein KFE26_12570 [Shewanella sp. M16]|uniref:hypothetical protein n=1 Tax=Shewanella sp. M16 TaxID=2830837 RepID=UPI001BAE85A9|nr:hypothetical protein [Shewanella sp. M16]MBS0043125.1 hypothetical protein [Shewanella sp. M16]
MSKLLMRLLICFLITFPCDSSSDSTLVSSDIAQFAINFWHQQLSQYIDVNADQVKLAQGNMALGSNSNQLWNIYNADSSSTAGIYYDPSQFNNFASDYGMILYHLPVVPVPNPDCNINQAIIDFKTANGQYPWNKTINDINAALNNSNAMSLNASKIMPNLSNSSSPYVITLKASYQRFVTYYAQPYYQQSPELTGYSPWYYQCALFTAYNDKTSPYWQSTFGEKGYMQQVTVALVVVENGSYCLTITFDNKPSENCSSSTSPSIIAVVISPIDELSGLWR